jgi:hypothetical protein
MCLTTCLEDDDAITLFLKKPFRIPYLTWLLDDQRNIKLTESQRKKTLP